MTGGGYHDERVADADFGGTVAVNLAYGVEGGPQNSAAAAASLTTMRGVMEWSPAAAGLVFMASSESLMPPHRTRRYQPPLAWSAGHHRLAQSAGMARDGTGMAGGQRWRLSSPDSMALDGSCQIAIAVFMRRKPSLR